MAVPRTGHWEISEDADGPRQVARGMLTGRDRLCEAACWGRPSSVLQVVRRCFAGGLDKFTGATYSSVAANGHNQAIRIAINNHRGETCIVHVVFESK